MSGINEENIVFLQITSFRGISPGAVHYYGLLVPLVDGDSQEVTFCMNARQADRFSRGCDFQYFAGQFSTRFDTEDDLIRVAVRQFKEFWSGATVLVLGRSEVVEPQRILIGPKEFKSKINALVKQYDKLDYDYVLDRVKIQELEERWQELWPRKYY